MAFHGQYGRGDERPPAPPLRRYDMNGRFQIKEVKLDFADSDECKTVLLGLSLAGHLEKTTFVPLSDRMEGAWLWTLLLPQVHLFQVLTGRRFPAGAPFSASSSPSAYTTSSSPPRRRLEDIDLVGRQVLDAKSLNCSPNRPQPQADLVSGLPPHSAPFADSTQPPCILSRYHQRG
jgi:hypothetical protein